MIDNGILTLGHHVHMECIWFVYAKFLQTQLDEVRYQWNMHYIRRSRRESSAGIPDVLFFRPGLSGHIDMKIEISDNRINALLNDRDIMTEAAQFIGECDEELVEYFVYVVHVKGLSYPPGNWEEAKNMYETIINLCN